MSNINIYELKNICYSKISDIIDKYNDNEYMLQRINNHIDKYLPATLNYEYEIHNKRIIRNNYLLNEQQLFIQVFLSKNKYYYLSNNNCFYEYNDKKYFIIKEDEIIHKLLSNISKERKLMEWKHKTKFSILKQIKERSLLNTIPETYTIQNILNFIYPSIFKTKNQAKYFLTVIGDNILKKKSKFNFFSYTTN